MKYSLFIFRRDLRLIDNKALNFALKNFENIIPIFIFTPEQVENNKFKSENAIQFMIESLKELDDELKKYNSRLHIFYGTNEEVITKILKKIEVENILFNVDYTVYAKKRDAQIKKLCEKFKVNLKVEEDYLLAPIGTFNKKDKSPYTVYTPFKNNLLKFNIEEPEKLSSKYYDNLTSLPSKTLDESDYIDYKINPNILVNGGRSNALDQLKKAKSLVKYDQNRNDLSYSTSLLSAYIKFGNLSIREVFKELSEKLGKNSGLVAQLVWREFYFYIAYYFPDVLKGKNYNSKYDDIEWLTSNENYKKWCEGKTGYPVVDAGMRELNKTGYMHNRARLITSNFLNRMLGMDWRLGEVYFANKLTDYDPSINNGNWQWVSSVGVDPKPYFQRLFNPFIQSEKFDNDGEYIRKWIPSLKKMNIPNKHLHNWEKYYKQYNLETIEYVEPIVSYKEARQKSVDMYREVL